MDEIVNHNSSENRYALSGKIMLSAIVILFTVVLLVVCLHIYARWYLARYRRERQQLRTTRRRTPHIVFISDLSTSAPATVSQGLEPTVLNSLPVFTCTANTHTQECAVCLSEFEENEKGRLLPKCNHTFHIDCIDMWFASHSTCPLCRSAVVANEISQYKNQNQQIHVTIDPPNQVAATSATSATSSSSTRSTNLNLSIQVPARNESFKNPEDEVQESPLRRFRSPGGRIMSLKRILNREGRPTTPTTPLSGGGGGSNVEIDLESGEVSRTPR